MTDDQYGQRVMMSLPTDSPAMSIGAGGKGTGTGTGEDAGPAPDQQNLQEQQTTPSITSTTIAPSTAATTTTAPACTAKTATAQTGKLRMTCVTLNFSPLPHFHFHFPFPFLPILILFTILPFPLSTSIFNLLFLISVLWCFGHFPNSSPRGDQHLHNLHHQVTLTSSCAYLYPWRLATLHFARRWWRELPVPVDHVLIVFNFQ